MRLFPDDDENESNTGCRVELEHLENWDRRDVAVQKVSSVGFVKKAVSYCGLCGAEKSSGNTAQRTPLSKQRNKHLQTTLIEAAKMAPRNSPDLAMLYDKEKQKGNANRATLAVARKLVAYLMAVDRGQRNFKIAEMSSNIAA
jgi:transposase